MQIVGSFTPNSAAAERVFSLLKHMFGDTQMQALADMIQRERPDAALQRAQSRLSVMGLGGVRSASVCVLAAA
eukprot:2710307-Prymnesium_polylepis.1